MSGLGADVPLDPGQEEVLATRSLFDPRKAARLIPSTGPQARPLRKRTAILVGINSYFDSSIAPLNYCVKDILAMKGLLEHLGYVVHALHDDARTMDRKPIRSNLLALLEAVCSGLADDDMLLVHLSCHGLLVEEEGCFLLMQDTWRGHVPAQGLAVSVIRDVLKTCKARQRVLLLDACHSGVEGGRSVGEETGAAEAEFNRRVYDLAEGFALLSSSTAGQVAHEWKEKEHGLFTYFVLEGLRGKAARPANTFVTVDDLKQYLQRELLRWNELHPTRPIQQPTAQTHGIGDIILADLPESESALANVPSLQTPPAHSATSVGARLAPAYVPAAELAVICGCDRDLQWTSWQRLAQSRENWLFLLPGPKGEAHELFVRRMLAECRKAFPVTPPPLALPISWRRRQFPPAAERDYRQALAQALRAPSDEEPRLVETLRQQRERYQLVLLHPVLDRGYGDPALLSYYQDWLPLMIEKSKSPKTLGVKLVQPIEWRHTSWLLRVVAPLLTALWPRPPESLRQVLSLRDAERLIEKLRRRWGLQLGLIPKLHRISEPELREFLSSQDVPAKFQADILSRLAPLNRESDHLLRDLMQKLPEYQESPHGRI